MKRISIFLTTMLSISTLLAEYTETTSLQTQQAVISASQEAISALQKYNGPELCASLEKPYAILLDISNNARPNELDSEFDILLKILAQFSDHKAYKNTESTLYLTLEQTKRLAIIEAKRCIAKLKLVQNIDQTTLNSAVEIYLEKLTFVADYLTFVSKNKKIAAYKKAAYTYDDLLDANSTVVFLNSFFTENPYLPWRLPTSALATYGNKYKKLYKKLESLYKELKLKDKDVDFVAFLPRPCFDWQPADLKYADWFTYPFSK